MMDLQSLRTLLVLANSLRSEKSQALAFPMVCALLEKAEDEMRQMQAAISTHKETIRLACEETRMLRDHNARLCSELHEGRQERDEARRQLEQTQVLYDAAVKVKGEAGDDGYWHAWNSCCKALTKAAPGFFNRKGTGTENAVAAINELGAKARLYDAAHKMPHKCDGNHAEPACLDPECWHRMSPRSPLHSSDIRVRWSNELREIAKRLPSSVDANNLLSLAALLDQ